MDLKKLYRSERFANRDLVSNSRLQIDHISFDCCLKRVYGFKKIYRSERFAIAI